MRRRQNAKSPGDREDRRGIGGGAWGEWRNYVTAEQLQSHWKILHVKLLNFINSGLPAYRQTVIAIDAAALLPMRFLDDIKKVDIQSRLALYLLHEKVIFYQNLKIK